MKHIGIFILVLLGLASCRPQQVDVSYPWESDETQDNIYDLSEIEHNGELIAVTMSGPDTYYDYKGRHLGMHYLICLQFAEHLGVRLRMDLCSDSAEMIRRLSDGDADLAAYSFCDADTVGPGWKVGAGKAELSEALSQWFVPSMKDDVAAQERIVLSGKKVERRVYAPMLSRREGIISRYDALFQRHARTCGWDWRLLAAQCYQESTFDPEARSWAGARGLMQIMPATADHLGLTHDRLTDPESNIAAAARYIAELDAELRHVGNRQERISMVLAAYNGGLHHLRDAMRLAQRDGRNPNRWADVRPYILHLSEPAYYQDTVVRHGYMRGQETAEYVEQIRKRWNQYRGVKTKDITTDGQPQRSVNHRHKKKFDL